MDGNAFDLGVELHTRKVQYILSYDLWSRFGSVGLNLSFENWTSVKYLDATSSGLNAEVDTIPNDVGGLYLFYVPCRVVPGITEFPFYIGRAQKTDSQNIRKRVKEYFQHFARDNERPKIYRMLKVWGPQLRLAYYPLPTNQTIVNLEKDIINSLLLPMNDQIPDKEIKAAITAFEL